MKSLAFLVIEQKIDVARQVVVGIGTVAVVALLDGLVDTLHTEGERLLQRIGHLVGRPLAGDPHREGEGKARRLAPLGGQIVGVDEFVLVVEHLVADEQEGVALLRRVQHRIVAHVEPLRRDLPPAGRQITGQLHRRARMGVEPDAAHLLDRGVGDHHHRAHLPLGADAEIGDQLGILQPGNDGRRQQCDVGIAVDEIACTKGGGRQQEFRAQVTCMPDTVNERYRIEIRYGRYSGDKSHHPYVFTFRQTSCPARSGNVAVLLPLRRIRCKDTNKRGQYQIYLNIAEREYLRRSQRYE